MTQPDISTLSKAPNEPAEGAVSSPARLFDEDHLRDPYPLYRELRDAGPVIWLSAYEGSDAGECRILR
jgi:cytochrome P450